MVSELIQDVPKNATYPDINWWKILPSSEQTVSLLSGPPNGVRIELF